MKYLLLQYKYKDPLLHINRSTYIKHKRCDESDLLVVCVTLVLCLYVLHKVKVDQ